MHSRMKARTSVTSRASVWKASLLITRSMISFVADLHLVNYSKVRVEVRVGHKTESREGDISAKRGSEGGKAPYIPV